MNKYLMLGAAALVGYFVGRESVKRQLQRQGVTLVSLGGGGRFGGAVDGIVGEVRSWTQGGEEPITAELGAGA